LPEKFIVMFDGWDDGRSTNLIGIFVVFWCVVRKENLVYLLRLAPLVSCDDYGANSHIESIGVFLRRFEKDWINVVGIIGDNCSTNLAIARRTDKPFVGCYSHRLNLGVALFLEGYDVEITIISKLMVALKTKKNCGRLRTQGCKWMPIILFKIKWAGYFNMIGRYLQIYPFLITGSWVRNVAILEILPSPLQHNRIVGLFEDLKVFQSISMGLQQRCCTLFEARSALDFLALKYPVTAPKLGPLFTDPQWRSFESAIIKVQGGQENNLDADESLALIPFLKGPVDNIAPDLIEHIDDDDHDRYANIIKRAKLNIPVENVSRYANIEMVMPTSNKVETLFSLAGLVLTDSRKSMSPDHLGAVLFLKCNRSLWNAKLVYDCRKNPRARPQLAPAPNPLPQPDEVPLQAPAPNEIVDNAENNANLLDADEIGNYQFGFFAGGEDGEFWDDDDEGNQAMNFIEGLNFLDFNQA
jgi:hypothetical protein